MRSRGDRQKADNASQVGLGKAHVMIALGKTFFVQICIFAWQIRQGPRLFNATASNHFDYNTSWLAFSSVCIKSEGAFAVRKHVIAPKQVKIRQKIWRQIFPPRARASALVYRISVHAPPAAILTLPSSWNWTGSTTKLLAPRVSVQVAFFNLWSPSLYKVLALFLGDILSNCDFY